MDEQKKQAQNPVQDPGSVVREIERPVSDYASEKELQVSEELEKIGVEKVYDKPQIEDVNEQIGVKPSLETTPIPSSKVSNLVLPEVVELKREAKGLTPIHSRRWEIEAKLREIGKELKKAA